jgi:glycyl-tRNA synthetase beta chain
MTQPFLFEIGCEEIPARMIAAAAEDLRARLVGVLYAAGVSHGDSRAWGGTRRLAVRVESVEGSVPGKQETIIGPPVSAAFAADGRPAPAGVGFAKKQGIEPEALQKIETAKGVYAGFRRTSEARSLRQVLEAALPTTVAAMSFPKTMRWGSGAHRFVRPVHWIVALHGAEVVDLEVFGVRSGSASEGHRFLAPGPVVLVDADAYVDSLRAAKVLIDPEARRMAMAKALESAAASISGSVVRDDALLDEVVELVEWPGIVAGRFDPTFLTLPSEILVTTLKHHQKSFSVRGNDGLLPAFLSVANTDRDPAGHVRRGNEWVVVGRLEDARYFWAEDRKRTLESRITDLARVTFHKKLGSYEEKSRRVAEMARLIADKLGPATVEATIAFEAARLAKADLVTGLVGEFPELQGVVGGLLLRAEGKPPALASAVAEHYKPVGADDSIPETAEGCVVAIADRLDTMAGLIRSGETPTGSRDPFGLRRAASGVFRILAEREWPLTLSDLLSWADSRDFLYGRLFNWLQDRGYTVNEILAVRRDKISPTDFDGWPLAHILVRLESVATLRGRPDFTKLVELTKRVDNILADEKAAAAKLDASYRESHPSALVLKDAHASVKPRVATARQGNDFRAIVDQLGLLAAPVATFFDDVLVLDPESPHATASRCALLSDVRDTLTHDFDIRELAGQADGKR